MHCREKYHHVQGGGSTEYELFYGATKCCFGGLSWAARAYMLSASALCCFHELVLELHGGQTVGLVSVTCLKAFC